MFFNITFTPPIKKFKSWIERIMKKIALIQLPIPQHNFGIRTGNIPLAAACLKQAADDMEGFRIEIIPETVATYLGDAAIIDYILKMKPDIIGFTIFNWNLFRSLYISKTIKDEYQPKIIFGGPEITADNLLTSSDHVDFQVFGVAPGKEAPAFKNPRVFYYTPDVKSNWF